MRSSPELRPEPTFRVVSPARRIVCVRVTGGTDAGKFLFP
jgi:hypothetical protein